MVPGNYKKYPVIWIVGTAILCFTVIPFAVAGKKGYTGGKKMSKDTIYRNDEVIISFNEKILVKENPKEHAAGGYFSKSITEVRFCKHEPQPPEVQQVLPPSDGYLCSLYLLPVITAEVARKEISACFKEMSPMGRGMLKISEWFKLKFRSKK